MRHHHRSSGGAATCGWEPHLTQPQNIQTTRKHAPHRIRLRFSAVEMAHVVTVHSVADSVPCVPWSLPPTQPQNTQTTRKHAPHGIADRVHSLSVDGGDEEIRHGSPGLPAGATSRSLHGCGRRPRGKKGGGSNTGGSQRLFGKPPTLTQRCGDAEKTQR